MQLSRTKQIVGSIAVGGVVGTVSFGLIGLGIAGNFDPPSAGLFRELLIAIAAAFGLGLIAGLIAAIAVCITRCKVWMSFFVGAIAVGVFWVAALMIVEASQLIPPGSAGLFRYMIVMFTSPLVPIGGFAGLAASAFLELTKPPES